MAQLSRPAFYCLVDKLLNVYEDTLRRLDITVPRANRDALLGLERNLIMVEPHKISARNRSLSHVVYLTLEGRKFDFAKYKFKDYSKPFIRKDRKLLFQGAVLNRAIGSYRREEDPISLGDGYLAAYLFFVGWTMEDLSRNADKVDYLPEEITLFETRSWTRRKVKRQGESAVHKIKYDIFLASPKLILESTSIWTS